MDLTELKTMYKNTRDLIDNLPFSKNVFMADLKTDLTDVIVY